VVMRNRGWREALFTSTHGSNVYLTESSTTSYWVTAAGSRVEGAPGLATLIVRLALTKSRTNNQAETIATPANESHIIHNATMGFVLLVKFVTNQDR
jgi:hypothetical protein